VAIDDVAVHVTSLRSVARSDADGATTIAKANAALTASDGA